MSSGSARKRTPGSDNRVLRVCRLLNRHRVRYLLAGGVAANLHGSVRTTVDVDILVPRDLPNMTRLLRARMPRAGSLACSDTTVRPSPLTSRRWVPA